MEYIVSMIDSGLVDKTLEVEFFNNEHHLEQMANEFFNRKRTPLTLIVKDFGLIGGHGEVWDNYSNPHHYLGIMTWTITDKSLRQLGLK